MLILIAVMKIENKSENFRKVKNLVEIFCCCRPKKQPFNLSTSLLKNTKYKKKLDNVSVNFYQLLFLEN